MRFSDLLRWSPKKEGAQTASPQTESAARKKTRSFWGMGSGRAERPAVQAPEGPATIHWIADGARLRRRSIVSPAESGKGTVRLRSTVPVGGILWVNPHGARPVPAVVTGCSAVDAEFEVAVSFDCPVEHQQGSGSVRLEWVDAEGRVISTPASVRNARAEAMIEATAAHSLPPGVLALLVGSEICCLGEVLGCSSEGDRCRVEIQAAAEACRVPAAA